MNTINQGKIFEEKVCNKLKQIYKCNFHDSRSPELISFDIGNPPKSHKFDLVSQDKTIIVECKDNNWSITNKTPHGKIATILKEVLYMSKLPKEIKKIIVFRRYYNKNIKETLAEYFVRMNNHLLDNIIIMELDVENNILKKVSN